MQRLWSICFALVLALSLILQGQSAAARVTMQDAAGQIVICTGSGPMTVFVDENGQPVDAPAPCPDCLILSVVALLTSPIEISAPSRTSHRTTAQTCQFCPDWLACTPCARAPPTVS